MKKVLSMINNPFTIETNTFSNYGSTLFIPPGTLSKYKATASWNKFGRILESPSLGISDIENEDTKELRRYSIDGRAVKDSHKGINIIQKNDGTTQKVVVK